MLVLVNNRKLSEYLLQLSTMKEKIIQLLDDLQVKFHWLNHPAVYTVADIKNLPEYIKPIKNLLVQEEGGGQKFLIVMAGDKRLDQKLIREKLKNKRLRFASDEILMKTLGTTPGSVSIFSFLNDGSGDVKVIIDQEILKDDEIGFHPNINTATIIFPTKKLEIIINHLGCDYIIMQLYDE